MPQNLQHQQQARLHFAKQPRRKLDDLTEYEDSCPHSIVTMVYSIDLYNIKNQFLAILYLQFSTFNLRAQVRRDLRKLNSIDALVKRRLRGFLRFSQLLFTLRYSITNEYKEHAKHTT